MSWNDGRYDAFETKRRNDALAKREASEARRVRSRLAKASINEGGGPGSAVDAFTGRSAGGTMDALRYTAQRHSAV